jgi:hypothetical protein
MKPFFFFGAAAGRRPAAAVAWNENKLAKNAQGCGGRLEGVDLGRLGGLLNENWTRNGDLRRWKGRVEGKQKTAQMVQRREK